MAEPVLLAATAEAEAVDMVGNLPLTAVAGATGSQFFVSI
jgi:hypothetical protein